jgi:hypothetical protein
MQTENDRIKRAREWLEGYVESWMFKDIIACIKGEANYAAALALSVYTEVLGGLIKGNLETPSKDNYKAFLTYMGYSDEEAEDIYRHVRCGLVHRYFIKRESTVHMWKPSRKGIVSKEDRIDFYVVKYFQEFQDAYYKYKDDLLAGKEDLLEKLEALYSKDIPSADSASKEGPNETGDVVKTSPNVTTLSSS